MARQHVLDRARACDIAFHFAFYLRLNATGRPVGKCAFNYQTVGLVGLVHSGCSLLIYSRLLTSLRSHRRPHRPIRSLLTPLHVQLTGGIPERALAASSLMSCRRQQLPRLLPPTDDSNKQIPLIARTAPDRMPRHLARQSSRGPEGMVPLARASAGQGRGG